MHEPTREDLEQYRQDMLQEQYEYEKYMHTMATDYEEFIENEIIEPYDDKLVEFSKFLKQIEQKHKCFGWEFDICEFVKEFLN